MPILCEETSLFPESLLGDPLFGEAYGNDAYGNETLEGECDTRRWWVARTKPRQEKALARQLVEFEVPFYLPLVPKENCIRGRAVRSFLPLFDGYVFLFANEAERVSSLTTNRICYLLHVDAPEQLHDDLVQINQLIESDAPLTVERRLKPGERVRVKSGPFMGMEGTLVARRNQYSRLLVSIRFLGQGASVEINDFQLEPL